MTAGLVVFAVTYLLIAGRRLAWLPIDRPAGALVGAVLAVVTGALTPERAARAIDGGTLVLLFGVMGMGAFLATEGLFERAAPWLAHRAKTKGRLFAGLVWGAGGLSALITNDAVCVLVAPVVVALIRKHRLPAFPFLVALATSANTGSVATLVGNPQNMLCASLGGLVFRDYAWRAVPIAIAGLAWNHAWLAWLFRRELAGPIEVEPPSERVITRRSAVTLSVIALTVVAYLAGADLAVTAVAGFAALLVVQREDPARLWERIDWSVLLFFAGLFVAVEALVASGAPSWALARFPLHSGAEGALPWARTALVFLVGSNVVSNVPFILVVRSAMDGLPHPTLGWELLAVASTFAGNLTLLGSVANVIVAEKGRAEGGLPFGAYLRVGFPLALATTALGAAWLTFVRG